jgi:hypothetical protein
MIRGFLAVARNRVLLSGRQGLLELRRKLPEGSADSPSGFFDAYPRFYSTSITGAKPSRLNARHKVLIQSNQPIIRGKSVLDIASHDGRWSFAAHQAGARHVLGIEAREHLVQAAQSNMREYGLAEKQVEFVRGDVFVELIGFNPELLKRSSVLAFFTTQRTRCFFWPRLPGYALNTSSSTRGLTWIRAALSDFTQKVSKTRAPERYPTRLRRVTSSQDFPLAQLLN